MLMELGTAQRRNDDWVGGGGGTQCSSNVAHADCIIDKAVPKRVETEQEKERERMEKSKRE